MEARGAVYSAGRNANLKIAGNMLLETIQNVHSAQQSGESKGIGFSFATMTPTGNFHSAEGSAEGAWSKEQTRIAAGNQVNVEVGEALDLKGAAIYSASSNKSDVSVSTKKLTFSDIYDFDQKQYTSFGFDSGALASFAGGGGELTSSSLKSGSAVVGAIDVSYSDHNKEGVTRATIDGVVKVNGEEVNPPGLNRDQTSRQAVTEDSSIVASLYAPVVNYDRLKQSLNDISTVKADIEERLQGLQLDNSVSTAENRHRLANYLQKDTLAVKNQELKDQVANFYLNQYDQQKAAGKSDEEAFAALKTSKWKFDDITNYFVARKEQAGQQVEYVSDTEADFAAIEALYKQFDPNAKIEKANIGAKISVGSQVIRLTPAIIQAILEAMVVSKVAKEQLESDQAGASKPKMLLMKEVQFCKHHVVRC
jgi:hypothetical protein